MTAYTYIHGGLFIAPITQYTRLAWYSFHLLLIHT